MKLNVFCAAIIDRCNLPQAAAMTWINHLFQKLERVRTLASDRRVP
jgi:hypothetical protein